MDGLLFEAKKKKKAKSKSKSRKLRPLKNPGSILRKARPYGAVNGGFRKRRRGENSRPVSEKVRQQRKAKLEAKFAAAGGKKAFYKKIAAAGRAKRDKTMYNRASLRDALRDKAPTMKL
jgi:hypothetical protein